MGILKPTLPEIRFGEGGQIMIGAMIAAAPALAAKI
jgi:hypothetical protein